MSIDPSSIPSFGVPQPQPSGQDGPPPVVVPDQDLVTQLLDQMELKHAVDEEGDLLAPWEGFRVYYMFRGEQKELFAVRAFYDRPHPIEQKAELLEALDEWNRETLWPKVYTHVHDDGVVRVIGESQMIVGMGVNINYFVAMTANWTQAAVGFDQWLVERLGLATDVDEDADGTATDGPAEGDAEDNGTEGNSTEDGPAES
ncbi:MULTISPECIES: YbjN domain-containing protein [Streptacidiphilus]|uniref:YbjN domain-containing protein n=1 Tax=Streptacidiphilus cavernicola TaxID=3342716 RepID=A0ABV6UU62_9ACTN|nr:YbjN domain-containing protein [Streptacidiphilus jeojiense]